MAIKFMAVKFGIYGNKKLPTAREARGLPSGGVRGKERYTNLHR